MHITVITTIGGVVYPKLGGMEVSYQETRTMDTTRRPPIRPTGSPPTRAPVKADPYAGLNANGPAQVKLGIDKKLSGPKDSYSSIAVHIEISARCDQTQEAIDSAKTVLLNDVLKALDNAATPVYDHLLKYV